MKKRLNQYTMAQFIDIACGDYSSIDAEPAEAKVIAESLIGQYNDTSDPTAARARLYEQKKTLRSKCKIALYSTLLNLVNIYKAYAEVRDILKTTDDADVAELDDEKIGERLELMIKQEVFQKERNEYERSKVKQDSEPTEEEIRCSFDRQTARLMAHFKFSINHDKISASVYANLVNMAIQQQRAQAANNRQIAGK
ncbi:MAG: hypothetical protein J5733_11725 [Bacteroidaceae bacterium]|nr:hypothetical protein [Bacteroidaceae bacterium]